MVFLISDHVLDTLVCDFCFKVLSVLPVRVYPNKKTKCGRCSETDEAGTLSKYTTTAVRSVFKCNNRFDGCKVLLEPSQVTEHEKFCKPKQYVCPCCSQNVPTYLIINHFQKKHNECLLKSPFFITPLKPGQYHKWFLYRCGNNLFFINFISTKGLTSKKHNYLFALSFSLLGDLKSSNSFNINLKIKFDGTLIQLNHIICNAFPSNNKEVLNLPLNVNSNLLAVMFSIETQRSEIMIIQLPHKPPKINSPEKMDWSVSQQRNIYLSENFKISFPDVSVMKGLTLSVTVLGKRVVITLYCFMCSIIQYSTVPNDPDYVNLIFIDNRYYLICLYCFRARSWNSHKLLSLADFLNIAFYCKWKCGQFEKADNLYAHEKLCEKQILCVCPIDSCDYSCKLFQMKKHFDEKHTCIATLFFYTSFGGNVLNLKISDCPMKILLLQAHLFVFVEIIWKDHFWKISLSHPFLSTSLRAVVLDGNWKFVGFIKVKGCVPDTGLVLQSRKIYLKCYVADSQKEHFENN